MNEFKLPHALASIALGATMVVATMPAARADDDTAELDASAQ